MHDHAKNVGEAVILRHVKALSERSRSPQPIFSLNTLYHFIRCLEKIFCPSVNSLLTIILFKDYPLTTGHILRCEVASSARARIFWS